MTRCHICREPCERLDDDRWVSDVWTITLRNRLMVDACGRCWALWPDDWKRFPAFGFGRDGTEVDEPLEALT